LHWDILIRTQANGKQAEICAQIVAGAVRSQIIWIEGSPGAPQPREGGAHELNKIAAAIKLEPPCGLRSDIARGAVDSSFATQNQFGRRKIHSPLKIMPKKKARSHATWPLIKMTHKQPRRRTYFE
jgi:hypothetical protein